MNTKTILVLVGVVVVGGIIAFVALPAESPDAGDGTVVESGAIEDEMAKGEIVAPEVMTGETSVPVAMTKNGSYEQYTSEKVARAATGDVVLFFRAPWCPTCRALDANIRTNLDRIPSDLTILDVDYDSATELKQKYSVTYQHTLVQVDESGNQIAKWSSSPTLSALVSQVK